MPEETRPDASALDEPVGGGRPLRSHLGDETPRHLLRGTVLDVVRGAGDRRERSRKMSSEPGGIAALVTDRRALFVVSRRDAADMNEAPLDAVAGAAVETMGDAVRLVVRTDAGPDYVFYPNGADEATVRAVADAVAGAGAGAGGADDGAGSEGGDRGGDGDGEAADPLDRLERLADLRDRGALTDEEFAAKKAALLDRI